MDFRILGPLEVFEGGRGVGLGGGKQRALLAVLLLQRNEIVSTDRLIDMLWSGRPPATAAKIVQLYVSQLRKVLGSEILVTQAPGYVLKLEAGQLDADRFEALLAEARRALADTAPEQVAALLREALALWRGRPLADFAYDDFAQGEIARLEELRLTALEERVDADLALGRHGDLAVELEALVSQHPLRERLCGQLMLARYRCGRQAEALDAYREARRLLDQELGLEPSQALQDLERAILRQDPALAPPPRVEHSGEGRIASIVPPSLRRRSAAFLVAGGVLVGGGIAAAVLELTGGSPSHQPVQNAVVEIEASTARVGSYTPVGTTPSSVAVGEGRVWVLNADDRTVSLIDPRTRRVVKTFATNGTPTELAVGDGALWVGIGRSTSPGPVGSVYTAAISRIDPTSALVTETLALPGPPAILEAGRPLHLVPVRQLAVSAGAVWAVNPDLTVSRIDPATAKLVAVVDVAVTKGIAAGREGVWIIGKRGALTRIDPQTNRAGQTITLEASGLEELALGEGSIWATDPTDGLVWRVEPGPHPLTRSIAVGAGVASIAFAGGAVWAASFVDGTVVRIDPRTNTVTARVRVVATPEGIAASGTSVWVSVAGGTSRGSLPTSACGPIAGGANGEPDVLIASDLPLQGGQRVVTRAMVDAIGFVLRRHGFRAGRYRVGYQSCDDSTAQSDPDFFKCAANAKAFAETAVVVGVIGPYDSGCAESEIPITNRLADPLALVSPANTRTGLTRAGPGVLRGEPGSHYPTGVRSYFRLAAPDDMLGAGCALLAKQLGLRSVYVLSTGETAYGTELAAGFRNAASKLGLSLAGSGTWDPNARNYARLAERIARSRAEGVLLGDFALNGGALIKALRARLGPKTALISGDGFLAIPDTLKAAGRAAVGMYVTFPGVALEQLGPGGRRFARKFGATQQGGAIPSGTYVPEAAEAAEVLLRAIAQSDGTRASVLAALRHVEVADGILGSFRFDANGDMTPALVTAFRITGRTAPGSRLIRDFQDSKVDRIMRVPSGLLAPSGG